MALGNALKYITKASTVVSSKSVSIFKQAQNFLKQTIDGENAIVSIFDNTGIAGFQFNVPQMEQVKLSNEITDYYSDNNTVFQDHIAYKPVIVTLSGLQGEYFYSVHRIKETPAGSALIPGKSTVILYAGAEKPDSKCTVPALVGKTPAEANVAATNAGILLRFTGTTASASGSIRVLSQSVEVGTKVEAGTVISVQLGDTAVID